MSVLRVSVCSIRARDKDDDLLGDGMVASIRFCGETLCTGESRRSRSSGNAQTFPTGSSSLYFAVGSRPIDEMLITILNQDGATLVSDESWNFNPGKVSVSEPWGRRFRIPLLDGKLEVAVRISLHSSRALIRWLILSLLCLAGCALLLGHATTAAAAAAKTTGAKVKDALVDIACSSEEVVRYVEVPVQVVREVVREVEVKSECQECHRCVDFHSSIHLGKALLPSRPVEAALAFRLALHNDSSNSAALEGLSRAALVSGDLTQALNYASQAAESADASSSTHLLKAHVLGVMGSFTDAVSALEGAKERWPDDPRISSFLGVSLLAQGQVDEAVSHLYRAVESGNDGIAAYNLGVALSQLGDTEGSIQALLRSADLHPGFASTHVNLGVQYLIFGRVEEARQAFSRTIQLVNSEIGSASDAMNDEAKGAAHLNMGKLDEKNGDLQSALRHYTTAAAVGGVRGRALAPLIRLYRLMGDPKAALDVSDLAVSESQLSEEVDLAALHTERGLAFRSMGRIEDAIEAFRVSLALHQDHRTLIHLGDCQREAGALHDAIQSYSSAIHLSGDPDQDIYYLLQSVLLQVTGEDKRGMPETRGPSRSSHGSRVFPSAYPHASIQSHSSAVDKSEYSQETTTAQDNDHNENSGEISRENYAYVDNDEKGGIDDVVAGNAIDEEPTVEPELEEPESREEEQDTLSLAPELSDSVPIRDAAKAIDDGVENGNLEPAGSLSDEPELLEHTGEITVEEEEVPGSDAGRAPDTTDNQAPEIEGYTDASDAPPTTDKSENAADSETHPLPNDGDLRAAQSFIQMGLSYASQAKGALALKQYEKARRRCPLCWESSSSHEGLATFVQSIALLADNLRALGMVSESSSILLEIGQNPGEISSVNSQPSQSSSFTDHDSEHLTNFDRDQLPQTQPPPPPTASQNQPERPPTWAPGADAGTGGADYGSDSANHPQVPSQARGNPRERAHRSRLAADVKAPVEGAQATPISQRDREFDFVDLDLESFLKDSQGKREVGGGFGRWLGGIAKQAVKKVQVVAGRI